MNATQITTTLAPLIAFLAGLAAAKGFLGLDAGTWTTIIGAIVTAAATVWGAWTTRKTALVSTVAAMPEVKNVTLTPAAATSTLNTTATPANVGVNPS